MRSGVAVRWFLAPVSAYLAWYAALILGLAAVSLLDRLCPPHAVVSGMCTAPWYTPAVDALFVLFAGFAAAGVVLAPAWIAPAHKFRVALAAFCLGLLAATGFAVLGDAWGPFAGAFSFGTGAVVLAHRWWGRATPR